MEFVANGVSSDTDANLIFFATGGASEEVGIDGVRIYPKGKLKTRIGNLSGVGKSGYGLWGENVFMDGRFEVAEGYIGNSTHGWAVDATSITALGTDATIQIPAADGSLGFSDAGVFMSGHATEIFSLGSKLEWDGTTLNLRGNILIENPGDIDLDDCDNYNYQFV